jgi:tetratricopeptide (TPR) repeat protein
MNYSKSTYHTKIYRDFKEIEIGEHRAIVNYYDEHEQDIRELDFQEYFELLVTFVNALFQLGKYQKHLLMVDVAIEASVMNNIKMYQEEDIFHKLLFQKAASSFHTFDLERADHILRELIKMNPKDKLSAMFLKKCLRRKQPDFIAKSRAISIFLFLATAVVICVDVLIIKNFFLEIHYKTTILTGGLLGIAVVILVGAEFWQRWKVSKEVNDFVRVFRRIKGV